MTTITGQAPLDEVDPEVRELIRDEKKRQLSGLELIAAEVTALITALFKVLLLSAK